jgi:transcriptional regulator of acetoin/glycerol metabolism
MAQPSLPLRMDRARRAFFERGALPVGDIPEIVLQSWRRCRHQGVPLDTATELEPLPATRLREMRERHERLWRLARPELDALAPATAAAGSIVLLTDAEGWVLDAEGNPAFLDKAGRVALMPGVCWNEARVGTNAIGTAIVEGRTVEVRGGEHYSAPHGILSCAATPIFDPYGRLAGVLDISGEAGAPHRHAPGLAKMAVAGIEHRWFDEGIPGCELLRLHHDPALLGTAREGLLAFRDGRLVAANRIGLKLFGLDRAELGRAPYEALFDAPLARLRDEGVLQDRQGRVLFGHVDAARDAVSIRIRPSGPGRPAPAARAMPAAGTGEAHAPRLDPLRQGLLERARRVLDAGLPVLVQGATGTGKEVFAHALHRCCARAAKPFVAVNCAALPEGLIEAELFGYEEGAFTGARRQGSAGLLRQAEGGVLFLDEIGDMPLALQPRLLRVLQERELVPLGGGKPVKLDFALVCATHRDLDGAIAEGRFRADLYYRIAHHVARLPSLREQPDRAALVHQLWDRAGQGRRLREDTLAALAAYDWPGNLRQLDACLRTLVALSEPGDVLGPDALPEYVHHAIPAAAGTPATPPAGDLQSLTEAAMRQALDACNGNVSRAARRLGISRSTLYRRLGTDGR